MSDANDSRPRRWRARISATVIKRARLFGMTQCKKRPSASIQHGKIPACNKRCREPRSKRGGRSQHRSQLMFSLCTDRGGNLTINYLAVVQTWILREGEEVNSCKNYNFSSRNGCSLHIQYSFGVSCWCILKTSNYQHSPVPVKTSNYHHSPVPVKAFIVPELQGQPLKCKTGSVLSQGCVLFGICRNNNEMVFGKAKNLLTNQTLLLSIKKEKKYQTGQ